MNSEPVENSECVQMASGSMSKRHSECSEEEPVRKIPKMTGEEAALYNSSWYEREEIAKMISAEDASSDFQDDEALETASQTKLHAAVSSENPSAVHAVLQSDPNIIDVTDSHGQTALHYAARNGHEEIVKMLLVKGASTHLQDKKGQTLLHIIANAPTLVNFNNGFYNEDEDYEDRDLELQEYVDEKYIRVMKAVLQNDPNITDITDSLGKTALHYAARNGYEEIVKILLVKGAIPHLQDKRGMTPLHSIVSNTSWGTGLYEDEVFQEYLDERYIRVMKEIVAAGANVLLQDKCGQTPLHISLRNENKLGAEVLVDANSENNLQDVKEKTPLHLAVLENVFYFEIVKKLLAAGVSARIQDNRGKTPLLIALGYRHYTSLSNLLVDADCENNLPDAFGLTPLHLAARAGRVPIARKLLYCGAHPHTKAEIEDPWDTDATGYPLGIALYHRKSAITELILLACVLRGIVIDWEEDLNWKDGLCYMVNKFSTVESYQDLCADFDLEVQKMKATKIHGTTVSYYDFATKHERKLALFLENKNIETVLRSINIADHLPNYGQLITFKVQRAKRRKTLTARCLKCFSILSKRLPSVLKINTDNILDCLSERDMKNFVKAFKFKA